MRLRPQPAVRGNVSQLLLQTDAPDPHLTHGKYFGVRSAAAPPTAAAHNAARKLSDNDSQDSSSATPNNSTQLSDVPHQDN